MRISFFLFLFILPGIIKAQYLGGFSDFDKKFFVFDQGNFRQLEHQPIKSFETGNYCLGYLTNGNYLKAYANHLTYDVSPTVTSYKVTNQLICFQVGTQLYAFENGEKTVLSKFVGNYQVGDSLIAYFDTEKHFFSVYYNHRIYQLEDGIIAANDRFFKVGSNAVAYVDDFQNFKLFYNGRTIDLFKVTQSVEVEVGRNILAFVEPLNGNFQVYFNNEIIELEQFKPKSYQVANEKIAYIDNQDNFKMFDNGNQVDISSYAPDNYQLVEDILVYALQGQLYVYVAGESYLVENYIPADYQVDGSRLAYINQNGHLVVFENGDKKVLSYETIRHYSLSGDVVIFTEGVSTVKVYYNNKTYTK